MLIHDQPATQKYTVGGKARGLFALQAAGFAIPPFFALAAEWFPNPIPPIWSVNTEQQTQVLAALRNWPWQETGLAVRSSVADEDGKAHAFPGMMDTVLNVRTEDQLWSAIEQVVRSAWSERALAYRQEKGLDQTAVLPAVVIQQMVQPEASGVLFTTNPTYPQEVAIHAVAGLGEGLVSGQRVPYEEYRNRATGEVVHTVPGEEPADLLSESVGRELHQKAIRLEESFGQPQDVEFCIAQGQVWLVQARPITAPIAELVVYDNSNIQESYCGVTTPLTYSFARRAYATAYTQTMEVLGLPARKIAEQQPVVQHLLGLVKGRIYYNINNWYRGLQLLPSFRQNKEDMERMMGLQESVAFIEDRKKSPLEIVRMLPALLVNLVRLLRGFRQLPKLYRQFLEHFQQHYDQFYQQDLSALGPQALWEQKEWLDATLMESWTTPIINDFYVMMKNGAAMRALEKRFGDEAETVLKTYVAGDLEIDSIKPTLAMMDLAKVARQNSDLVTLISDTMEGVHSAVQQQFPEFGQQVTDYLHLYGDRTVGELKLETRTMRVKPDIFYSYLRNYLQQEVSFSLDAQAGEAVASAGLKQKLAKLKAGIHRREAMRLARTRLFGMYRSLFLEMGQRFADAGAVAEARDIFYLEEAEIGDLAQAPHTKLLGTIEDRKRQFAAWEDVYVPARVVDPSRSLQGPPPALEDGMLRGEVCVAGAVTGEAIVITRPEDNLDVKGKIICALRTDPGWAALFPVCKAVLIEKGSALSHSVILLRELGIPTLINIPGLTQAVTSGQSIQLDEQGNIHLSS